jgi:hypothetical protein
MLHVEEALVKFYSFSFAFIPGIMLGIEFPEPEEEDFILILDLGVFRVIFEKWSE